MRNPLVPVTVAFAAGIWSAPYFFFSASQQIVFLAVIFLCAVLLLRLQRHFYGMVLALLGLFLCGTFLAAEEHAVLPPGHIESLARSGFFQPEEESQITGWARTPSVKRPGGEYFDLELIKVQQSAAPLPANGVVRLYHYISPKQPDHLEVAYGTVLSVAVRNLRRPRNFMTPGFYDYEASMERQEIYFSGVVRQAQDLQILPGHAGSRWRSAISKLRGRLLSNLDRLYPPEQDTRGTGAILKAMLLGDDNWLRPESASAFQETGTYHLLVVSGLHVGALAFGLFWLLAWFRLPEWMESAVVALAVITFTYLANARIPAVRACLMILFYLAARMLYRKRALLNSIAGAALLLLILHPSDLRDSGFQLSFLAVLTIATIAAPLVEWSVAPFRLALRGLDEREKDKSLEPGQAQFRNDVRVLLDYLCDPSRYSEKNARLARIVLLKIAAGILAIAAAFVAVFFMQAGLSLLMATYFHRVVWSGIAANLLVLPLTGLLIPVGFIVLSLSMLWWPAAAAGSHLLGGLVVILQKIVDWSAHVPRFDRRVPPPPLWLSGLFFAVLVAIAVLASRRSRLVWAPILALFPLGLVLTLAPYPAQIASGRLELSALDVGQGDSLFITFPRGHTMLVDGGGAIPTISEPTPRFDVGERIVSPYLWSRSLKAIDVVVLTHAHWDHLGGLMSVLRNFHVGELWIGPGPEDLDLGDLLQLAASRGIPIVRKQAGDRREIDGVELVVLSPAADWHPARVSNNDSLVIRLGYGPRHILLAGDAEARIEKRLVNEDLPLASDVLKVGHHGSRTSTTADFLGRVAPRFGLISVGALSRFGHPNREVLDALDAAGIRTYRTDADGSITASTDGNRIEFSVFRDSLRPWPPFRIYPPAVDLLLSR